MANHIAYNRNWLQADVKNRSEQVLLKVIDIDVSLLEKPLEKYMEAIRKDKKQVGDSLTAVLISKYGEVGELTVVHDVSQKEIQDAIVYFINLYKEM